MEWIPVPSTNNAVFVTRCGRVKTLDRVVEYARKGKILTCKIRGREISPHLGKQGYKVVSVTMGDKRKKYSLHRLLGEVFVHGYSTELSINHINGIKTDNRIDNLEWIPLADNTKHQWATGLVNLRGANHPSTKLTIGQVKAIRKMISLGVPINCIATLSPVSSKIIERIRDGAAWNSVG